MTAIKKDNPILRKVCDEVNHKEDHSFLINHMFTVMYASRGVGLAAPQVGDLKRIIVVHVSGFKEVFINPVITKRYGGKHSAVEGCLSFPGKQVYVTRHRRIWVEGYNQSGVKIKRKLKGLAARCVQHEVDHLDGICID